MVLRKESDIAINLFREFKIEQGSKLRAENELQLKCKSEFDKCDLNPRRKK